VTVRVALAVVVELELEVAVTFTCTLSSNRYGGGVYCPVLVIEPAPVVASPPETDQVTDAAPPEVSVAVNCSTGAPDAAVELQPVQLVSMEPAVGETENSPFDELVEAPPQPARMRNAGTAAKARARAGHDWRDRANLRPPQTFERRRRSAVTDAVPFKSSSAFPLAWRPNRIGRR
jgi:hypothetical protein